MTLAYGWESGEGDDSADQKPELERLGAGRAQPKCGGQAGAAGASTGTRALEGYWTPPQSLQ